jgi:transcriptional regulator with XRE-family HTH domain
MLIGLAIKSARTKMGLSQKEVADKADIECSHLSKLENCHHEPTIEVLERIGSAIGIDGWRIYRFASKNELQSLTTPMDSARSHEQHM